MSFATFRRTLFTVHMWIGLILGILLAALGLSGSLLVYDDKVANLLSPPPRVVTAGDPVPLDMVAAAARRAAADKGIMGGQVQIVMPEEKGAIVSVRVGQISPMGNMANGERRRGEGGQHRRRDGASGAAQGGNARGGMLVFVDPVTAEVVGTRSAMLPPILTFAHQLHGNFLMGREGRAWAVGPLGVAMLLLGVTGLVLWWPKRGQWKYAFLVRRTATGLRFHRELHAATGIWIFLVFMIVSFSGVVIAWPQTFGVPQFSRAPVTVENTGEKPIGAQQAANIAIAAMPGAEFRGVTLPPDPGQAIAVNFLSHEAMNASVLVNPYTGAVLQIRDPSASFMAWQRPVHQGSIGPIWKFLVFLSGLVPTLFVVTGIVMWAKKRKRRVPMTMMTDDVTAGEVA